jgi:hypothetical protein
MWLTARSGFSRATASILAALTPTRSEPTKPGVFITAMASSSRRRTPLLPQCFINDRHQALQVGSRCHFGHHATETGMQIGLRCHHVGTNLQCVVKDGRCRFIARCLNR